jgi:hypothetical protein
MYSGRMYFGGMYSGRMDFGRMDSGRMDFGRMDSGRMCSIERDARALLSLYVSVPEREILNIVSQRYQTRLHLRLFCLPLVHGALGSVNFQKVSENLK